MTNTKARKKNNYSLVVQKVSRAAGVPSRQHLQRWLNLVLTEQKYKKAEVVIRIVDEAESAELNQRYRHKPGPTNVLAFPFEAPNEVTVNLLGDLVICAQVVAREASEQNKLLLSHWAHMVIHGVLHLLGYDHLTEHEAQIMESLEIKLLSQLGYSNPYE